MDPITSKNLALIRQQEMLEAAANARRGVPVRSSRVFWHVGRSLVLVGQRLMEAAKPSFEEQPLPRQAASDNC